MPQTTSPFDLPESRSAWAGKPWNGTWGSAASRPGFGRWNASGWTCALAGRIPPGPIHPGPIQLHQPCLTYIADVLPSLGEEGVQTCMLRHLVPEGALALNEPDPGRSGWNAPAWAG
ncbi:hypothetical protein ACT3TS_03755 [Specibacter sp. AOP5-B1-6]|uniref:hypothetical protein n=1 Tax=Specibacter sp. AOP5-B1-6 TaxID=3457653 RepID=UPI00402B230F